MSSAKSVLIDMDRNTVVKINTCTHVVYCPLSRTDITLLVDWAKNGELIWLYFKNMNNFISVFKLLTYALCLQIIPIEGDFEVNDEPQKTFKEILPEIVISKWVDLSSIMANCSSIECWCILMWMSVRLNTEPATTLLQPPPSPPHCFTAARKWDEPSLCANSMWRGARHHPMQQESSSYMHLHRHMHAHIHTLSTLKSGMCLPKWLGY